MILSKIDYSEFKENENYWEIHNASFGQLNLIVGLNATGKTRLLNVINGLSQILSKKRPNLFESGSFHAEFINKKDSTRYTYNLNIAESKVVSEEMLRNDIIVLKRYANDGEIFSDTDGEIKKYSPPVTELTVHVRRDTKEYPFLEKLLEWATNFHGYRFTEFSPKSISIPVNVSPSVYLEDLSTIPYLLAEALKMPNVKEAIIEDFSSIGYPIEKVVVESEKLPGTLGDIFLSSVKEKDLLCFTKQINMSQGMYRAFSLVVIVEYLLTLGTESTVAIDDIGEGLDFDRSSKITKLIFDKIKDTNIQLIATSNDRFLINSIDINYLNLLERSGHVVYAYNCENSKEKFEDFKITGLNNFDFFSGRMYKD